MLASLFHKFYMRDTMQIGTASGGSWGSDPGSETWTYASTDIPCMIRQTTNLRTFGETDNGAAVPIGEVRIYAPAGTAVTQANRIKVTYRNRVALGTPEYYEIIGAPLAEASHVLMTGRRMTGNTDD
jgi:hypothetical protein